MSGIEFDELIPYMTKLFMFFLSIPICLQKYNFYLSFNVYEYVCK